MTRYPVEDAAAGEVDQLLELALTVDHVPGLNRLLYLDGFTFGSTS